MSTRYATIIPNDDGPEGVSNIAQIEGAALQVSSRRSPTACLSA